MSNTRDGDPNGDFMGMPYDQFRQFPEVKRLRPLTGRYALLAAKKREIDEVNNTYLPTPASLRDLTAEQRANNMSHLHQIVQQLRNAGRPDDLKALESAEPQPLPFDQVV